MRLTELEEELKTVQSRVQKLKVWSELYQHNRMHGFKSMIREYKSLSKYLKTLETVRDRKLRNPRGCKNHTNIPTNQDNLVTTLIKITK